MRVEKTRATFGSRLSLKATNKVSTHATEGGERHLVIWQTVRKHWTTALATSLAVALSVTFYTLGQTRIYQSTATVQAPARKGPRFR